MLSNKTMRIIFITIFAIGIVFTFWISSNDSEPDTFENAISYDAISPSETVNEIIDTIPLNEQYTVCLYLTGADTIGVAYVDISDTTEYEVWQKESISKELIKANAISNKQFKKKSFCVDYSISVTEDNSLQNNKLYEINIDGEDFSFYYSYQCN